MTSRPDTAHRATWMRPAAIAGTAVIAAIGLSAFAADSADAVSLDRYGWWSRLNQNGVDLGASPSSPPRPAGTMAVGLDAQGATAVGAVHFDLGADESDPVLNLRVDPSSTNAGADGIVLLACRAAAGWKGGANQDWAGRPSAMCDSQAGGRAVAGARTSAEAWTFRVGPLLTGRAVDVVIVPAAVAGGPSSYQVNFTAPTSASMVAVAAAATTSMPPASAAPATIPAVGAPPTFTAPDPAPPADFSPVADPTPSPTAVDDPTSAAALPSIELASPVRAVPSAAAKVLRRPWVRVLAGLQVIGAAVLAWYIFRQGPGDPKDDSVRGLGPFVASRHGEVPLL